MKYTCKRESENKNRNILTLQKYKEEQKEIFKCTGYGNLNDFLQLKRRAQKRHDLRGTYPVYLGIIPSVRYNLRVDADLVPWRTRSGTLTTTKNNQYIYKC